MAGVEGGHGEQQLPTQGLQQGAVPGVCALLAKLPDLLGHAIERLLRQRGGHCSRRHPSNPRQIAPQQSDLQRDLCMPTGDGWQPLGGICAAIQAYGSPVTFLQAIVKYAPE